MNAFQRVLTSCPWFPIIGNHEASDGDHYKHYEAIAWGEVYGTQPESPGSSSSDHKSAHGKKRPARPPTPELHSTATTALGRHLSQGTFYGLGLHSTVPSNTSRYGSVDIGLIHYAGLDLNDLDQGQLAWLEEDLAAANANRANTPWIIVSSHFPVWSKAMADARPASLSLEHYLEDENVEHYDMYDSFACLLLHCVHACFRKAEPRLAVFEWNACDAPHTNLLCLFCACPHLQVCRRY